MRERDLIQALSQGCLRWPGQLNDPHQADAEILRLGNELWAITVDDFSAREDRFEAADPWLVGWNVVAATLSDLYSVGAVPRFFLPAICLPSQVSEHFVSELSRGTREALLAAECFLLGGDVGQAEPWRYVGTALGPIPSGRPVTRRIPPGDHSLWVSGPLGGANLAAALGQPPPRFPLRLEVAELVRDHATACIDTSGGLADALWNLGQATAKARIDVEVASIPLAPGVEEFATDTGLPPLAVLLGGAGEYELLFAIPESFEDGLSRRLEALECRRVGRARVERTLDGPPEKPAPTPNLASLHHQGSGTVIGFIRYDGHSAVMREAPPCPRDAGSVENHVREVAAMAEVLFGGEIP